MKTDVYLSKTLAFLPETVYHIPTQKAIHSKNQVFPGICSKFVQKANNSNVFPGRRRHYAVSFHQKQF
jgi:hypothetical protein